MLTVDIDVEAIEKRIDDMLHKLNHFGAQDMPDQLFNWEAEDLHRRKPWVSKKPMRSRRMRRAMTIIRPHSVSEMKRSHAALIRAHRRHQQARHWSTRPILRHVLWEKLKKEMEALMPSLLSWRK
jgi:hypothetical protein